MTPALFGALFGAIAAGLIRLIDDVFERRRRRESTFVAIAAEVRTICDLIRHQEYLEAVQEQTALIRTGNWSGEQYVIDIRANYFSVYESLSGELGLLKPHDITKIVSFYSHCKSAIDSTRPDGPMSKGAIAKDIQGNLVSLEGTLSAVLILGDDILSRTRKPLLPALLQ